MKIIRHLATTAVLATSFSAWSAQSLGNSGLEFSGAVIGNLGFMHGFTNEQATNGVADEQSDGMLRDWPEANLRLSASSTNRLKFLLDVPLTDFLAGTSTFRSSYRGRDQGQLYVGYGWDTFDFKVGQFDSPFAIEDLDSDRRFAIRKTTFLQGRMFQPTYRGAEFNYRPSPKLDLSAVISQRYNSDLQYTFQKFTRQPLADFITVVDFSALYKFENGLYLTVVTHISENPEHFFELETLQSTDLRPGIGFKNSDLELSLHYAFSGVFRGQTQLTYFYASANFVLSPSDRLGLRIDQGYDLFTWDNAPSDKEIMTVKGKALTITWLHTFSDEFDAKLEAEASQYLSLSDTLDTSEMKGKKFSYCGRASVAYKF